jgi:hypothetical protein
MCSTTTSVPLSLSVSLSLIHTNDRAGLARQAELMRQKQKLADEKRAQEEAAAAKK